jgi:homoserine kinase
VSEATAVASATIGNLGVGFDVLGAAIPGPRDRVRARRRPSPGVEILRLDGDGGRLPWDPAHNTASVAAAAVLARSGAAGGLELEIDKGIPLAGGLGSSAASAVAAALAADAALGAGLGPDELLACALAGEAVASGAEHADNVAPCLYGGIVLTPTGSPPRPVSLPVPRDLAVALLHPPVELATRQARAVLGADLPLTTAVAQWGRLAAFVAALYREDWELLGRSLVDLVAEPQRAHLVPGFREMQAAALAHGALGCSLSGAGPSVFALCRGVDVAGEVGRAMADALNSATGLEGDLVVGEIERQGAHVESP